MRCSTISFVCCFLLITPFVKAQSNVWDSLNKRRLTINQNHLYVLGSWAAANIVQGAISATNTTGSSRYLHQMNAYWNTVNLAIAGLGIWALKMQLRQQITPADLLQEQKTVEKLLLLNSGLDVAYIMTGLYMKEKGLRLQNDRNIGFGNSLVIQGSFLDMVQYFAHQKNGKAIHEEAKKVQWGVSANGLGLTYRL
jgi:hypothetical protein